jgi:hypothetical protein
MEKFTSRYHKIKARLVSVKRKTALSKLLKAPTLPTRLRLKLKKPKVSLLLSPGARLKATLAGGLLGLSLCVQPAYSQALPDLPKNYSKLVSKAQQRKVPILVLFKVPSQSAGKLSTFTDVESQRRAIAARCSRSWLLI